MGLGGLLWHISMVLASAKRKLAAAYLKGHFAFPAMKIIILSTLANPHCTTELMAGCYSNGVRGSVQD